MRIFTAESVDLSHLNPGRYSYEPKNIHIQAVQVTPENIGKLSLEFEEELYYDAQGRPYFVFTAERVQVEGGELANQVLYARVTDWIVPLRGELHIYRDITFQNTFELEPGQEKPRPPAHLSGPRPLPKELLALRDKLSKDAAIDVRVRHKATGAYGETQGSASPGSLWVKMDGHDEVLEYSEHELEFPDLLSGDLAGTTGTQVAQHHRD